MSINQAINSLLREQAEDANDESQTFARLVQFGVENALNLDDTMSDPTDEWADDLPTFN